MEELIKIIKENTNLKNPIILNKLYGGMSNNNYLFKNNNILYTIRIPGKDSEKFVNRKIEEDVLNKIKELDLNNETIYYDYKSGIRIAKYIKGENLVNLNILDHLNEVCELLKKIHNSNIKLTNDYDKINRLNKYELYINNQEKEYYEYKKEYLKIFDKFKNIEKKVTHGDLQPSNIIYSDNNKIHVLDWEFTSLNDPYYDISCFGNNDFKYALLLLELYLNRKPNNEDLKRLLENRIYQCLQWYNVALYKDKINLSKDLNLNFLEISKYYLNLCKHFLEEYNKL